MLKVTLLFFFMFNVELVFACECNNKPGANFLNQVKKFDIIVYGTVRHDAQHDKVLIDVREIYKGKISTSSIELSTGPCGKFLSLVEGKTLVLGLNTLSSTKVPTYYANGCITSVLYVTDNVVTAGSRMESLPAMKTQRIGILSRTVKLSKLRKKIARRVPL